MRWLRTISFGLAVLLACPAPAADWDVPNRVGAIFQTLAQAADGDVLRLAPGTYAETLVLDRPVTIDGQGHATLDGGGHGTSSPSPARALLFGA